MNYVSNPNIPDKPVKLAIIDARIGAGAEARLAAMGISLIKTCSLPGVYSAISYHPDIMLHHVGERQLIYAPGMSESLLNNLKSYDFELIAGCTIPGERYPYNIAYNVARLGKYAFHNKNFTDPVLKNLLTRRDVEFIHVKQGYSKCSVSIVNENCIITSDKGIAIAAEKKGIEALLLEMDENILLSGVSYGFIGGSTFLVDKNKWCVAGNIEKLKSAKKIIAFMEEKGINILSLTNNPVMDIGSVIPLMT